MYNFEVVSQDETLPIENYDQFAPNAPFVKHSKLFKGWCKRGLLVGGSGCGKTSVMISLLKHPNGLRFENVYLYSKTLHQPKYDYLRNLLKPIKGLGFYEYAQDEQILAPNDAEENSIIIFDDVVCENQSIIRDYFCFGRHKNIDCFYLCQTYSSIPKQLVRDNANLLIVFQQDATNLKHIYDDHVNVDMSYDKFKSLCSHCWTAPYGFLVIDKDGEKNFGRYRKGFDCYFRL